MKEILKVGKSLKNRFHDEFRSVYRITRSIIGTLELEFRVLLAVFVRYVCAREYTHTIVTMPNVFTHT